MKQYSIRCRLNGEVFAYADTLDGAENIVMRFEDEDRAENMYEDDYYEIYDNLINEIVE